MKNLFNKRKILWISDIEKEYTYDEKDLKEAVKEEEDLLDEVYQGNISWEQFFDKRKEIFGKELCSEEEK